MIHASHIVKDFKKSRALNDISFSVPEGSIFGIIGANGAGKSTLFGILATLIRDFSGEVLVGGLNIRHNQKDIHRLIGYVPGRFSLYKELTARENLEFFARIYGCFPSHIYQRHHSLWESLAPFADKRTRYLSGGMRQKLSVCCALVHQPRILLLDEPTTGIDPRSRHELWQELVALRNEGVTILASTHYLNELCFMDHILFLHEGRQLLLGSPEGLVEAYGHKLVSVSGMHPYRLFSALKELSDLPQCYLSGKNVHLILSDGQKPEEVQVLCRELGLAEAAVKVVKPSIEDVLIRHLLHDHGRVAT
jgi:ABC-2 type transport system ATP-binding protein